MLKVEGGNVLQTTIKATRPFCIPQGFVGGIFPPLRLQQTLSSPSALSFSNTPFLFSFSPSLQLHDSGTPLPHCPSLALSLFLNVDPFTWAPQELSSTCGSFTVLLSLSGDGWLHELACMITLPYARSTTLELKVSDCPFNVHRERFISDSI